MKNNIFSNEFVGEVYDAVESTCGEGTCIKAQRLAVEVGLTEDDHLLISQLVKRQLSDRVGVKMGPGGGFHLLSIPLRKKDKSTGEKVDDELVERLNKELKEYFSSDSKRTYCTPGYLTGRLDLDPQKGVRDISHIIKEGHLPGFTTRKGAGIVQIATNEKE